MSTRRFSILKRWSRPSSAFSAKKAPCVCGSPTSSCIPPRQPSDYFSNRANFQPLDQPPSAHSQQLPVRPEKRMRSVEIADRHLMRHHAAESLPRKPAVEMKGRRLDPERRLAQFFQIQIDRVIRRWANRGWDTGKHRQCRTMNVTRGDQLHARIAPDNRLEFAGIEQILAVHVPDAGLERRMVQEQ